MSALQTEAFVPLTAPPTRSGDTQQFRVTVIPQAERVQNFKPLDTESHSTDNPAAPRHNPSCNPRVSLQREGEQVTGIRIQCGCGQVIDLACVYGDTAK